MKRIVSMLLSIALALSISMIPVNASDNNEKIITRVGELEQKYGISITYPNTTDGNPAITLYNLETLDLAFSSVTPTVVKQVSEYYQAFNGNKININYVFSRSSYDYKGGVLMALFDYSTSKINVYMPTRSGKALISGENPIALVHEFGHAFHVMCMNKYGKERMSSEWLKFNRGLQYDKEFREVNPDDEIFISSYASTSFEEDFAETFANTFVRSSAGTGFKNKLASDSKLTGLGRKVAYIEQLLPLYLKNTGEAVSNYRRIYKTPVTMTFEGHTFSGEYLQYISYPQPKNVLTGILNGINVEPEKATWVRDLGAWRVVDPNGNMFFVFPGGTWSRVSKKLQAAAA